MKPLLDESLDPLDPNECAFCGRTVDTDNPARCPAREPDDARCRVSEPLADGIYVQPFGRHDIGPFRSITEALKATADWCGEELRFVFNPDGITFLEYRASPGETMAEVFRINSGRPEPI